MKEVKFIDPKSDYGFKVLFGTDGAETYPNSVR